MKPSSGRPGRFSRASRKRSSSRSRIAPAKVVEQNEAEDQSDASTTDSPSQSAQDFVFGALTHALDIYEQYNAELDKDNKEAENIEDLDDDFAVEDIQDVNQEESILAKLKSQVGSAIVQASKSGVLGSALAQVGASQSEDAGLELATKSKAEKNKEVANGISAIQEAKSKARDALERGLSTGSLESMLKVTTPCVEEGSLAKVRANCVTNFLAGIGSAAVHNVAQRKETVRVRALDTLLQGLQSGALDSMAVEKESDDLKDMKTKLAKAFVAASKTNVLAGALQKTAESKTKAKAKASLLEGLKSGLLDSSIARCHQVHYQEKTRNLLLEGLSSGKLESAILKAREENHQLKVRNLLIQGLSSGRLESAIKQGNKKHREEKTKKLFLDYKEKTKSLLMDGLESGKLESVLTRVKEQRSQPGPKQDHKEKTRNLLMDGLDSGKLEAALTRVKQQKSQQAPKQQVTEKTRNLLVDSLDSGKLEAAMLQVKEKRSQQKVKNLLLTGLESGDLEAAIKQAHSKSNAAATESVQQATKDLLVSGLSSGKLELAIQEAKKRSIQDKTRNMLLQTVAAGNLDSLLHEASTKVVKKSALNRLLDGLSSGKLETAIVQAAKHKMNPRQNALKLLEAGLESGKLDQAILHAKAEPYRLRCAGRLISSLRTGELRDALRKVKDLDCCTHEGDAKEKVKSKLLASLSSGKLEEAAENAKSSMVDMQRKHALGMLEDGLASGRLDDSLQQAKAQAVCQKAKESISLGITSGKLEDALVRNKHIEDEATPEQKNELRAKALNHLMASLRTSKIEDAFQEATKQAEAHEVSIEKIKQKALPSLLDALKAGALDKALAAVAKPQSPQTRLDQLKSRLRTHMVSSAQNASLSKALDQVSGEKAEKMRKTVCENLMESLRTGKLENAFKQATQPPAPAPVDLRSKAHAALVSGLQNGKLEAAVSKEAMTRMDADQIRDRFRENLNAFRYEVSHDWSEDRASLDLGGARPMESYFHKFGHAALLAKASKSAEVPASSTAKVNEAEAVSRIQTAWVRHQDAKAAATLAREKREAVSRCLTPTSQKPRECQLIKQCGTANPPSQMDSSAAPAPVAPVAPTSPKAPQVRKNPRRSRRSTESVEEAPKAPVMAVPPVTPKVDILIPTPPADLAPPSDVQRPSGRRAQHRQITTAKPPADNSSIFRMDSDTEPMASKPKTCDLENEFEALSPKVEFFNMSSSKPPGMRRLMDPSAFPQVGLTSPSKKAAPTNFPAPQSDFSHWLPQATTPRSRPNALLPDLAPSLTATQKTHTAKMFDSISRKTPRGGCF
jgi:hypothetical protein